MKYDSFKEAVLQRLDRDVPEPKVIAIHQIMKNNGDICDGLAILENGINIAPILYLNRYYAAYKVNGDFSGTYNQILSHYKNNKAAKNINVGFFTDFEKAKPRLIVKLINREKNCQLLGDVPHIDFLDLAVVFCFYISIDAEVGNATILIRNEHLGLWNQTAESLFPIAMENSRLLLPHSFRNMNLVLDDLICACGSDDMSIPEDPLYPMYVLTNKVGFLGASCLLYEGLIRSVSEQFNSDLYILPSSIHEVIIVPTYHNSRMKEFSEMVREVNCAQVADDEILSDHAYYYSYHRDEIIF